MSEGYPLENSEDWIFALPSRRSVREAVGVARRAPNYEVRGASSSDAHHRLRAQPPRAKV